MDKAFVLDWTIRSSILILFLFEYLNIGLDFFNSLGFLILLGKAPCQNINKFSGLDTSQLVY